MSSKSHSFHCAFVRDISVAHTQIPAVIFDGEQPGGRQLVGPVVQQEIHSIDRAACVRAYTMAEA